MVENVQAALPFMVSQLTPPGWIGVQAVLLRTDMTTTLPLYNCLPVEARTKVRNHFAVKAGAVEETKSKKAVKKIAPKPKAKKPVKVAAGGKLKRKEQPKKKA